MTNCAVAGCTADSRRLATIRTQSIGVQPIHDRGEYWGDFNSKNRQETFKVEVVCRCSRRKGRREEATVRMIAAWMRGELRGQAKCEPEDLMKVYE